MVEDGAVSITLYYIILYYIILYYIILCYVMFHYIILYHTILDYNILLHLFILYIESDEAIVGYGWIYVGPRLRFRLPSASRRRSCWRISWT